MTMKGTSSLQRTAIFICEFMITRLFNKSNLFELRIVLSAENNPLISNVLSKLFEREKKPS